METRFEGNITTNAISSGYSMKEKINWNPGTHLSKNPRTLKNGSMSCIAISYVQDNSKNSAVHCTKSHFYFLLIVVTLI